MSFPMPSFIPTGPESESLRHRLFGVYSAIVTEVTDPDSQGRVQIELPWVHENDAVQAHVWARLSTVMAGNDRGTWFIPEVGDEVLISFVAGDPRWPVVLGALWNGVDAPPETMDRSGENNLRGITSRSGHKLTFDDTAGSEKVEVITQGGHTLVLDDAGAISVHHSGGAEIKIEPSGMITITALNQVVIKAPSGMKIEAAQLTVDAPISKFSGVVKAETVITNAVVSSSYTPGAGNVW